MADRKSKSNLLLAITVKTSLMVILTSNLHSDPPDPYTDRRQYNTTSVVTKAGRKRRVIRRRVYHTAL